MVLIKKLYAVAVTPRHRTIFCHLFTTWQAHKTTTTIYIEERGGQKQAKVRKSGFVFLVFDYSQRILAAAPVY